MAGHIKLRDRLIADSLSAGSAIAQFVPLIGAAVGHRNDPPQLAARWRHAGIASADVESWQVFEGEPESGGLPKDYEKIALIGVEKWILDELQARHGGSQAATYALGSTTMVGTVEDKPRFLSDFPGDSRRYAVGMRVGTGALKAAIALRPYEGEIIIPVYEASNGGVYTRDNWPESVPIV